MLDILPTLLFGLWFGLPLLMWLFRLAVNQRIHGIFLYIGAVFLGYLLFVGCAWAADVMLEQRMNSFDLDGDGGIGGEELTPEAQNAIDDWANDTGRRLAIFTGFPLTAIWAALCLSPLCIGEWLIRRLISKRNSEVTREAVGDVPKRTPDDGNPFSPPGNG